MSDYFSTLPVELIHQILDNVTMFDIFFSICLVNKNLRSACLNYPRLEMNFSSIVTSMNKYQFDCICALLLHSVSQLVSLTLFDKNDPLTPAKNEHFFSQFNCIDKTFTNLRSLTLTYITYDTWCLFKCRLSSAIVKLSIHLVHSDKSCASQMTTSDVLNELLVYSSSLKDLSVKMSNYSKKKVIIRQQNPAVLSSVQYFRLEDITVDLLSLFSIVPALHSLEISCNDRELTFDRIYSPTLHLQKLQIEFWGITWTQMTNLILSFPQLTHLVVIADDLGRDMGDGFAWAQLLKDISHFECKLQFNSQLINLNSFRTSFWVEEKKWFLTHHENRYTRCPILYSNFYSIDNHLSHPKIAILSPDTYNLQSTSLPYIYCSTLNYQDLNSALLHQSIYVNEHNTLRCGHIFPMNFRYLYYYLDASRIIICHTRTEWIGKSLNELVDFLRNTSHLRALSVPVGSVLNHLLRHQWSDIVYLRIEPDFNDSPDLLPSSIIETLCHSFPRLKRLDIHSSSVSDLPQLLSRMQFQLTDLIIRQPQTINNERLITRQWIKQNCNLKTFYYSCDVQNCVTLWF